LIDPDEWNIVFHHETDVDDAKSVASKRLDHLKMILEKLSRGLAPSIE